MIDGWVGECMRGGGGYQMGQKASVYSPDLVFKFQRGQVFFLPVLLLVTFKNKKNQQLRKPHPWQGVGVIVNVPG